MTDARTLTLALHGKWYGRYGLARCPAHGDKRPSLSIANGHSGHLLLSCKAGCEFTDVLAACRERGLLDPRDAPRSPSEDYLAKWRAEDEAAAAKRERQALAVWNDAKPIGGTLAETYLRSRGITCALPETLRFHPNCWHASAKRLPAMVALVEGADSVAVHRTYLRSDGQGKADVEPAKAMLGRTLGGAVRLTDTDGRLVVAEGIETALSLSCGLLRGPATVWAALSTSGVAGLRLPDQPSKLTIAPDGDAPGRDAAQKLGERADALGWEVSLLPAPDGRDWNDLLAAKGGAA